MAGSSEGRRAEFFTGRACARAAMRAFELPDYPIPSVDRRPLWPDGVVGGITHTRGFVAAAVAAPGALAALGIDVEAGSLSDDAEQKLVLTDAELATLPAHADARARAATTMFSAKESAYKALDPELAGALHPQFHDVEVALDGGRFTLDWAPRLTRAARSELPRAGLCQSSPAGVATLVWVDGPRRA